ncbi:hypothetical protein C6Y62_08280 [Hyphomicrobium sulfonivorans]|nr:hypothetical protein [Hyphomicrobium sulfonivorans]
MAPIVVSRSLPQPPAYLAPVAIPEPDAEKHAEVAAQQNRAALVQANARLKRSRDWYLCTRQQYEDEAVRPKTCGGG